MERDKNNLAYDKGSECAIICAICKCSFRDQHLHLYLYSSKQLQCLLYSRILVHNRWPLLALNR